jgi:hypothetical protein
MAQDKSIIIVPPISFINNTLISASPIDTDTNTSIEDEIKNISKVLLINYSLVDEQGVEYTLFMYKQDFYTIDNVIESYGLSIVNKTIKSIVTIDTEKSKNITAITRIGPSNKDFIKYATEYVRLYKLSRMATPEQSSNNEQTASGGGSRRQEYEQKKRV